MHIGVWIDERMAHPGLGGQVDHPIDVGMAQEDGGHALALGDIGFVEYEPGLLLEQGPAPLL